MSSVAAAVYCA